MSNICRFARGSLPRNIGYKQNANVNNNNRCQNVFFILFIILFYFIYNFFLCCYLHEKALRIKHAGALMYMMHSLSVASKRKSLQRAKANDRCKLQCGTCWCIRLGPTIKVNCIKISVHCVISSVMVFALPRSCLGTPPKYICTYIRTLPGCRSRNRFLVVFNILRCRQGVRATAKASPYASLLDLIVCACVRRLYEGRSRHYVVLTAAVHYGHSVILC